MDDKVLFNILIPIGAALFSGVLGSLITLCITHHREKVREKKNAFIEIFMLRGEIGSIEFSRAINRLPAFFDKNEKIMAIYTALLTICHEGASLDSNAISEKFIELTEEMAKDCGFKNIDWKKINKSMPYTTDRNSDRSYLSNATITTGTIQQNEYVIDNENGKKANSQRKKKVE